MVLVVAIGVLAWVNANSVEGLEPATLVIRENGQEVGSISLEEIISLGSEDFTVMLRSSGKDPVESVYTGLPLATILEAVKPELLSNVAQVSVKAIDGYAVAFSGEELLEIEHLYLVWQKDGKPLGDKSSGGSGPLLVIPRQDEFGQRWCKFAVEVDVR